MSVLENEEIKENIQYYLWDSIKHLINRYNFVHINEIDFKLIKAEGYSNCHYHAFFLLGDTIYQECIWIEKDRDVGGCLIDGYLAEDIFREMPSLKSLNNVVIQTKLRKE